MSTDNEQVRSTSAGINAVTVRGLGSSKCIQTKAWDFMGHLMEEDDKVSIRNENLQCKFCIENEKTCDMPLLSRIYSTMDTTSIRN